MRHLMLLRHAKTERAEPGERDRDRKLTNRGRADSPLIGGYMARHGLVPEIALVSPARRTQETWALVASAWGKAPRLVNDERLYNATSDTLIAIFSEIRAARSLLVIGHNPSLHEAAMALTGSGDIATREQLAEKLPTCGLVVIDLPSDDWAKIDRNAGRLERFVTPRLIADAPD
jgi:phosphohistidine phosphatase